MKNEEVEKVQLTMPAVASVGIQSHLLVVTKIPFMTSITQTTHTVINKYQLAGINLIS